MKQEGTFYRFGTGSRTGVYLKGFQKELLATLARFDFLTFDQMFEFYQFFEKDKSSGSFRKKRKKWSNYKLMNEYYFRLGQSGNKFRYYTIGKSIIKNVLIPEGYLDKSWLESRTVIPSDSQLEHSFGTRDVLIKTLLSLKRLNKENEVEFIRPDSYPYHDRDVNPLAYSNPLKVPIIIKPDYILKKGNLHINLETDAKTEVQSTIEEKIVKYAKYCRQYPEQEHIVLFTILDKTAKSKKATTDGLKRIANIKKKIMELSKELEVPNLTVYVVPLRRGHIVVEKILLGERPFGEEALIDVEIAADLLDAHNSHFDFDFSPIDNAGIYLPQTPDYCHAHLAFQLKNRAGTYSQNVLFTILDEGNVRDIAKLNELNRLISRNEFKNNIRIDKVIATYQSVDEWENDVRGIKLEHVLFVDNQTLTTQLNQEPIFYRTVSPFVMEATTFEGN